MSDLASMIILSLLSALFVAGSLRACDIEYANEQKQIEEWKFEQTYISPSDEVIIDWNNPPSK